MASERERAETEDRLALACDELAQSLGGELHTAQKDGVWLVSIERDDQAQVGEGHTKAQAMSDLIAQFR
jgi:hypothetical protein